MGTWEVIVIIGIVLILFSLVRRRGGAAKYPEIVQALLYDVKLDQALADAFSGDYKNAPVRKCELADEQG